MIRDATIENVKLTNTSVNGGYAGGLVAISYGSSINSCRVNGSISGYNRTGILIGIAFNSTINDCSSSGNVEGGSEIGGLIGESEGSTINNCSSSASVTGTTQTGGLIGWNNGSSISNSYSSGIVFGGDQTGGFAGEHDGYITSCYSSSIVNGNNQVGGLIGNGGGYILNSYSIGSVNGVSKVGGLIGENNSSIINYCYSTGKVNVDSSVLENVGGFAGISYSELNNCFWDKTINPTLDNGVGTGKTTEEMKLHSTYSNTGWDPATWCINENFNNGYPFLAWQNGLGIPLPVELDEEQENELPKEFRLLQNSPNPFNPNTKIEFHLSLTATVTLKIYDILGTEITTLVNDERIAGSYIVYWNGKNNYGQAVSSGVYLYKLTAGNFVETRKMNLVK